MRFYQLHKTHEAGTSAGFDYFTTEREARRAFREWMGESKDEERVCDREGTTLTTIEIDPSKAGILRALNRWASHPNNG
jgi:hypothetical protein